jgi:hypothetical protein
MKTGVDGAPRVVAGICKSKRNVETFAVAKRFLGVFQTAC